MRERRQKGWDVWDIGLPSVLRGATDHRGVGSSAQFHGFLMLDFVQVSKTAWAWERAEWEWREKGLGMELTFAQRRLVLTFAKRLLELSSAEQLSKHFV